MATKYTLYFSEATKPGFDIQSYTKNGIVSPSDDTLITGAAGADTTLKLYGKGNKDYGEAVFQDLVYMLENFAAPTEPFLSIEGQLWYDNDSQGIGSPLNPRLLIRNSYDAWTAVILANGVSPMTGELILVNPSDTQGAVPLHMLTTHEGRFDLHLTAFQNTFLDDIEASPLTSAEVIYLVGTTSNVQTQIDSKISRTGDIMDAGADLTFQRAAGSPVSGGEVRGLPVVAVPYFADAAPSKWYIDDLFAAGAGNDGVVSQGNWISTTPGGSPPIDIAENTLELVITHPVNPAVFVRMEGISRTGHTHNAADIPFDNAFDSDYGTDVQVAIEKAAADIDLLATGGLPPSATIAVERIFESLTSDLTAGTVFETLLHFIDDDRVSITVNGIKQYNHTHGTQVVTYNTFIDGDTLTALNELLTYDFNISIDGGATNTITINDPAGSPPTTLTTHADLLLAVNAALLIGSPQLEVVFQLDTSLGANIFTAFSSGSSSTISITAPTPSGSPPSVYLFDVDGTPATIIDATFLSNAETGGSPAVPDDITIAGDQTADFPVGKTFTIQGSLDVTYGTYDGVYSVHDDGAVFDTTNTIIPLAHIDDFSSIKSLFPGYIPIGSPLPPTPDPSVGSPASFGAVHLSPLGNIVEVATAVTGIEGDYKETDNAGGVVLLTGFSRHVVFNYDILTGSKIESLLYV